MFNACSEAQNSNFIKVVESFNNDLANIFQLSKRIKKLIKPFMYPYV